MVQVGLGRAVQGWIRVICAIWPGGAILQLPSLAPTHPSQQEKGKSRHAFRNIIQLMTAHQILDSEKWLSWNRLRSSGAWACYSCLPFIFEMLQLARWVQAHGAGSNTAVLPGPILVTLLSTNSLMIKTTFIAWHDMSQKASYRKKANHAWMSVSSCFASSLLCSPLSQNFKKLCYTKCSNCISLTLWLKLITIAGEKKLVRDKHWHCEQTFLWNTFIFS